MSAEPKMDASVSSTVEALSVQFAESEESFSKDDDNDDVTFVAVVPRHSLKRPRSETYIHQSNYVKVVDSNTAVEYNDDSIQYKEDWRNLMRMAADMHVRLDDLMVRGSSEVDGIQRNGRSSLKQCFDDLLINMEEFYERAKEIHDKLP